MKTPFTTDQFLAVFEKYNTAVFPSQIFLFVAIVLAIVVLRSSLSSRNRIVAIILSVLWLWNGLVYQLMFFRAINKAAVMFSVLISLQAIFMLFESLIGNRLVFSSKNRAKRFIGYGFIFYGLLLYPVIDLLMGHNFTGIISAGLPCPTTIITFGFFLLIDKLPRYLLIIPALWALMGISAAVNFGIYQDFVMVLAAAVTVIIQLKTRRRKPGNILLNNDPVV